MPEDRTSDKRIRKNIMMPETVLGIAKGMVRERYFGKNKFSHLLEALVMDAYKRQLSGEDKNLSELLAENRKLRGDVQKWKDKYQAASDVAAKYHRLFEEADGRLEAGRKVANPLPSM